MLYKTFGALAVFHPQGHPVRIEVGHLQVAGLQQAQARAIGGHQKRPMREVRRVFEERGDLLAREDLRQALPHPGTRQLKFGFPALEGHTIQKLQRAAHNIAATVRELALLQKVKQVALDFLRCNLFRRAAVELGEPRH